jgi:hypothetical protein
MYGEWLRVSPADLRRGQADPGTLWALVERAYATEFDLPEPALTRRRWFGTEKVWNAFAFLLRPQHLPVSLVLGESPLPPHGGWTPRCLSPVEVRAAATALSPLTVDALIAGVDATAFRREEIYPHAWGSREELRWVADVLPDVTTYFTAAAVAGDAVLCWIS